MNYLTKLMAIFNNYVIARWRGKPSTAFFWYLPEPPRIQSKSDYDQYCASLPHSPKYLMDYQAKLKYTLQNKDKIIVLPYDLPIGNQVNPEAAFQYALGLHDQYYTTQNSIFLDQFLHYAYYFLNRQTANGRWNYTFDWYASKSPWSSALAQSRGASVMVRAWLYTKNEAFREAAKKALSQFSVDISAGGFLHLFPQESCPYFEEYPETPTGVINGFMASLISIWDVSHWLKESWIFDLWKNGLSSLEKMLPYYSNGWWSLYDLDSQTPVKNVNSPRYHLLEIHYLGILSLLSQSVQLQNIYQQRIKQYSHLHNRLAAFSLKLIRKVLYR